MYILVNHYMYLTLPLFSIIFPPPSLSLSFRDGVGMKVVKAFKRSDDGITHSCVDMLCALMQPMHDNFDLKQEQLNKSSLLSSKKFVEMLIELLRRHIVSRLLFGHAPFMSDHTHLVTRYGGVSDQCFVGLLHIFIVSTLQVRNHTHYIEATPAKLFIIILFKPSFFSVLLLLLVATPLSSETTPGAMFDMVLELVAGLGRYLFKLFQHPSLAIVKAAGLLMKSIIEVCSNGINN